MYNIIYTFIRSNIFIYISTYCSEPIQGFPVAFVPVASPVRADQVDLIFPSIMRSSIYVASVIINWGIPFFFEETHIQNCCLCPLTSHLQICTWYIYICTHTHSATFLQKKNKLYFIACVRLSTTKEADSRALADPTPKKV